MYPKRFDFHKQLQDIATVLMGGIAAEELTHPHLADKSHGKKDISDFKGRIAEFRSEAVMDVLLDKGHQKAKTLLNEAKLFEQHRRLCHFLATKPNPQTPNGRRILRVMKGLSSYE
jgi:hypothetical protein